MFEVGELGERDLGYWLIYLLYFCLFLFLKKMQIRCDWLIAWKKFPVQLHSDEVLEPVVHIYEEFRIRILAKYRILPTRIQIQVLLRLKTFQTKKL